MELADSARRRAGGPAALARVFGVSRQAVNGWGRTRPIPRHVRERLRTYALSGDSPAMLRQDEAGYGDRSLPPHVEQLLEVLHADASLDPFAGLPRGYRERYLERAREIEKELDAHATRLKRSLEEYMQLLLAEARGPKSQR